MKYFFCALFLLLVSRSDAKSYKVLFIGNSYTDVNNLPELVKQIAAGMNDTLIYEKSCPGGYTFANHSAYAPTLNLIAQGGWDYVVLQEQSQYPSFPLDQVEDEVYPYARKLDSLVHVASPCAKTVFYMTWGRKNGDADNCPQWPPVCTYQGMDSLLQLRYTMMAQMNQSWLSPVAKIWRYLKTNNPAIELYAADGSHPSPAGSYAAGLSFYAVLFGKDPTPSTYTFGLSTADANSLKFAAKSIAFDSLTQWRQYNQTALSASFTYTGANNTFDFVNTSTGSSITAYTWNFGDGSPVANTQHVIHTFTTSGAHQVCLTVKNACGEDMTCNSVTSGTVGIHDLNTMNTISIYPNPAKEIIQFKNIDATYNYTIYNTIGFNLKQGRLNKRGNSIDIRGLAKGIYYLELRDETSGKRILKWVKE